MKFQESEESGLRASGLVGQGRAFGGAAVAGFWLVAEAAGYGSLSMGSGAAWFWGRGNRLGTRLRGACDGRCHVESGGGNLLSMVGLGLDVEECSGGVLGLLGEWQLNQEFGGGVWREGTNCRAGSTSRRARDEG